MLTRPEIADILKREVYAADARYKDARQILNTIISDVPGTIPHPDGTHRPSNAVKEEINAREALDRATKRNYDFTVNGIIPKDLRRRSPVPFA